MHCATLCCIYLSICSKSFKNIITVFPTRYENKKIPKEIEHRVWEAPPPLPPCFLQQNDTVQRGRGEKDLPEPYTTYLGPLNRILAGYINILIDRFSQISEGL